MAVQTRIYASGAFCFGETIAVNDLLYAKYSAVILWSLHVHAGGDLWINDTLLVANGVYNEGQPMNLASRLATLRKNGTAILFSVGSGGADDWGNIQNLIDKYGIGPVNPLYQNMLALKTAMKNAGGDIDAIDFDNEDNLNADVLVKFTTLIQALNYSSVTFCPWTSPDIWQNALTQVVKKFGPNYVSAIHLQCYSGGNGTSPQDWYPIITAAGSKALMIPGLATNQANPGPWWDNDNNRPGGSVVETPNVAQFGGGDWSGMLRKGNYATPEDAMKSCNGPETFFFYCKEPVNLGPGKQFVKGDAVFFGGYFKWGSAPQCTGYSLSGGCSNIYDPMDNACPKDVNAQFYTWGKGQYPVNGGFIWMYDSIVNCVLSGQCGEQGQSVGQIAASFKDAIVKGLGG